MLINVLCKFLYQNIDRVRTSSSEVQYAFYSYHKFDRLACLFVRFMLVFIRKYHQNMALCCTKLEFKFRSKAEVLLLLLLIYCLLYFPLFVGVLCLSLFVMHNFVSILVLQSS